MSEVTEQATHVRILHCSDIHLDSPFADLPPQKSEERKRALRSSFLSVMQYVRDRGINIVLISGDLFEANYATNATAELLIREFRNCPNTTFVIAPGKYDRYRDNPIYTTGRLPENCRIFTEDRLTCIDLDEYNISVWGWAFVDDKITESLLAGNHVGDSSRINLVCGYADLDPKGPSDCCPITVSELRQFGADYYALGSRHDVGDCVKLGSAAYNYCGSLESISFAEPGLGGANLIVLNSLHADISFELKSISFARLRFATEKIDVTGVSQVSEIVSRVSRVISEKQYGIDTSLRVELYGNVEPGFLIPRILESDALGLYYFDLVDKTLPLYGAEHFKKDMTVRGELYRRLCQMFESENEEDRLTAARAFRVGLAALENREIDL